MKSINDISFWQDTCDFSIMRTQSAGVILRAGQGFWEDKRFQEFRVGSESAGFPFGNYFYFDNDVEPKRQAEKWSQIIGYNHGVLGCWLDLEDAGSGKFGTYKAWWDCVAYFKQFQPSAVLGIYTRASYFDSPKYQVPINHAFRNLPLWIAHYRAVKPTLPKGWDDWLIWQWTDQGDGVAHGVGSKEIDTNWYKGELGNPPTAPSVKPTLDADFGGVRARYNQE